MSMDAFGCRFDFFLTHTRMPIRTLLRQGKPLATASTCLTGTVTRPIVPMITTTTPTRMRMAVIRLQPGCRYLELCGGDAGQCQIAMASESAVGWAGSRPPRPARAPRRASQAERYAVPPPSLLEGEDDALVDGAAFQLAVGLGGLLHGHGLVRFQAEPVIGQQGHCLL